MRISPVQFRSEPLGGIEIVGQIENRSDQHFPFAKIEFTVYGHREQLIDHVETYIDDLRPGQTRSFSKWATTPYTTVVKVEAKFIP